MEAADDLRELDRQIESHREYDHLSANQLSLAKSQNQGVSPPQLVFCCC